MAQGRESGFVNNIRGLFLLLVALALLPQSATADASRNIAKANLEKLSGHAFFEHNVGQAEPWVKYLLRGAAYEVRIAPGKAQVNLPPETKSSERTLCNKAKPCPNATSGRSRALEFKLVGSQAVDSLEGKTPVPTRVHYYFGRDPRNWVLDVPAFEDVTQHSVYPGIDLAYHGNGGQLEYQFFVSPGSDPSLIRVRVRGVKRLKLSESGDLILDSGSRGSQLILRKPSAFESDSQGQSPISVSYRLVGKSEFAFAIAPFDRSKSLIIDPVLTYSTFLGDTGAFTAVRAVAVGKDGSAFFAGAYNSSARQRVYAAALRPDGKFFRYIATLAPFNDTQFSQGNTGYGIAVDSQDNAYITGVTHQTDFPTTGGVIQPVAPSPSGHPNGFVTVLNPFGQILASTYLGADSSGFGITVDGARNVFVIGQTSASNFPTSPGVFQQALAGPSDVFVTKLNSSLSTLLYSTLLGGSGTEFGFMGVAVDSSGAAYAAGGTTSGDFPTTPGVLQRTSPGGEQDAFVAKLSPDGRSLVYSTYLGGSSRDSASRVAVSPSGDAYVVGQTNSANFPASPGAFQTSFGGGSGPTAPTLLGGSGDAFIVKLDPTGSSMAYATFLGGSSDELGDDIAVDASGNAYIVGTTTSINFPLKSPLMNRTCAAPCPVAFIAELDPTGSQLVYSTYLGGSNDTRGYAIALASGGAAVVTGETFAIDFPTTPDAVNPNYNPVPHPFFDGTRGFLSKISACNPRNVQFWSQGDPLWASDPYDHSTATIQKLGCGLTSLAMALDYAGFTQVPLPNGNVTLDPGSLNSFMINNNGYDFRKVDWASTTAALSLAVYGPTGKRARYVEVRISQDLPADTTKNASLSQVLHEIKKAVCDHGPVIVGVKVFADPGETELYPHHFVLVTAVTGSGLNPQDFIINDPHPNPTIRQQNLGGYGSSFSARGYIQDPPGDGSELIVSAANVELKLTAPDGALTGYDPPNGLDFWKIPNSSYTRDGLEADDGSGEIDPDVVRTLGVFQPTSGVYQLSVWAPQLKTFSVTVDTFLQDNTRAPFVELQGITAPGYLATFQIQLNTAPGSTLTVTQLATFDSGVQDIANLRQLGLITDSNLAQCLTTLLQNANAAYQAQDFGTMSNLLNSLKAALLGPPPGISPLAAQVLNGDADYLLSLVPTAPIYPVANCVNDNGDGTYTASFGYQNDNAVALSIPAGTGNFLTPPTPGQDPATYFYPGQQVSPYQYGGVFSVTFDGNNLFWTVRGPDGVFRTATASRNSAVCLNPGS